MVDGPTITHEAQDDGTDELMAALDSSNKGVADEFTGEEDESTGDKSTEGASKEADAGEGDKAKEGEGEGEGTVKEDAKEATFSKDEENRELRQLLRAQKRELAIMKSKIERLANREGSCCNTETVPG